MGIKTIRGAIETQKELLLRYKNMRDKQGAMEQMRINKKIKDIKVAIEALERLDAVDVTDGKCSNCGYEVECGQCYCSHCGQGIEHDELGIRN